MSNYQRPDCIGLDTPKGTKVKAIFENGKLVNGTDADQAYAMQYLQPDIVYTIDEIRFDAWHSAVYLLEFPGILFNTVHFTYADEKINQPILKNQQLQWEEIKHDHNFYLLRAKVFGGWLVMAEFDALTPNRVEERGHQFRPSMSFVPDPNHEWKIDG